MTSLTPAPMSVVDAAHSSLLHDTPPAIYDPLGLLPDVLGAHMIIMLLAGCIVLPCGVGLALRGHRWHKYVQLFGTMLVFVGVALALASGQHRPTLRQVYDSMAAKRHVHSVVEGQVTHVHSDAHTMVGFLSVVALVMQVVLGCCTYRDVSDMRVIFVQMHRTIAVIVALLFVHQLVTGLIAAFQLIVLSGVDQCVGHFGPALGMLMAAALSMHIGQMSVAMNQERLDRAYMMIGVEASVLLGVGILALLYSLYSEWPYEGLDHVQHLLATLTLTIVGAGGLWTVTEHYERRQAMPRWLTRGLGTTVVAALIAGIVMIAHPQHSDYSSAMHKTFGVIVLMAGLARALMLWRAFSLLLMVGAFVFVASQHGASTLYEHLYSASITIEGVIVLMITSGVVCWLYAMAYDRLFLQPARVKPLTSGDDDELSQRISDLVDDDERQ